MKPTRNNSLISLLLFCICFSILYLPIVFVVVNSFNDAGTNLEWSRISLKWFKKLIKDKEVLAAILISIKIAILSATISTFIGFIAATATEKKKGNKNIFNNSLVLPSLMPEIAVGIALLLLFMYTYRYFSWPKQYCVATIVIGHVMSTTAYSYIALKTAMSNFDHTLEEAAKDLGIGSTKILFNIYLPVIMPAIVYCWIFIFALSLDDFIIASFLSGPGSTTITMLIFSSLKTGINPVINAFSTIFILSIALLIYINKLIHKIPSTK